MSKVSMNSRPEPGYENMDRFAISVDHVADMLRTIDFQTGEEGRLSGRAVPTATAPCSLGLSLSRAAASLLSVPPGPGRAVPSGKGVAPWAAEGGRGRRARLPPAGPRRWVGLGHEKQPGWWGKDARGCRRRA